MTEFSLIPLRELRGYCPKRVVIYPDLYILSDAELIEQARKAAESLAEICVCIVRTEAKEFALGRSCMKGLSERYILFNAKLSSAYARKHDGQVRVVTPNTGRGALSNYWYDEFIQYEKGGVV